MSLGVSSYRGLPFDTNQIAARSEMVDRTTRWSLTPQHCSKMDNNVWRPMKFLLLAVICVAHV